MVNQESSVPPCGSVELSTSEGALLIEPSSKKKIISSSFRNTKAQRITMSSVVVQYLYVVSSRNQWVQVFMPNVYTI